MQEQKTTGIGLAELAEQAYGVAKSIIEDDGRVIPVFLVLMPDNEIGIIMCPFGSLSEKNALFTEIALKFREWGVSAYVFVSEAWISRRKEGDGLGGVMPSEDPNRGDILTVVGASLTGEKVLLQADVKTLNGKRSLERQEIGKDVDYGGRLYEFLGAAHVVH